MFSINKPTSFLGVDVGAGGIKLVELKREKNRAVLFTYGITDGASDVHHLLDRPDKTATELLENAKGITDRTQKIQNVSVDESQINRYAGLLKAVCKAARVTSKVAVASLPVSAVFHAVVTMPAVKKEDFDHIVKAEVKKLLPYPLDEMVLDFQRLTPRAAAGSSPTDGGASAERVLVNAVPRALVVFYSEIFKKAGLKLDSLEPESVALSRSLVGRDNASVLLIDIGAERTNFFIIDQKVPMTHHSIELGGHRLNSIVEKILGVDPGLTEQIKTDVFTELLAGPNAVMTRAVFTELFGAALDPIVKEIDYSLELYLRQTANAQERPERVVLTGGGSFFPYLADIIADTFKIKCFVGDPWGRVVYQERLRPVLRSIAPRMSVAIGLALRNVV